jgi:hypothetical protein
MHAAHFDALTRHLSQSTSRRTVLKFLGGAVAAVVGLVRLDAAARSGCRLVCRRTSRGRQCRRVCAPGGRTCPAGSVLCAHSIPAACRRVCRKTQRGQHCRRVCYPGRRYTACTNVLSDKQNCGACGRTCSGTCVNGQCLLPPPIDDLCAPIDEACFSDAGCCDGASCVRGRCLNW